MTFLVFILLAGAQFSYAGIDDVDKHLERARKEFNDRFEIFTQEGNVMGPASKADGTQMYVGNKQRFNRDDGNPFQNDLTYHDEVFGFDSFVSEHGEIEAGGGSSALERLVKQKDKEYKKKESEGKEDKPPQKGITYDSIFQTETRKVRVKDPSKTTASVKSRITGPDGTRTASASASSSNKPEYQIVDRMEIQDEVTDEIKELGANSYNPIAEAGRDPERRDDPNAMPTMSFLYEAASRAAGSLWNNSLAHLGQRRAYNETDARLNEDVPSCAQWRQQALQALRQQATKRGYSADEVKEEEKYIQSEAQKCEKISQTSFSDVAPKFTSDPNSQQARITQEGPNEEDGIERDLRVQLETLDKAGVDPREVTSNWDYSEDDARSEVTLGFDENGQPSRVESLTVSEQLGLHNEELAAAQQDYQAIQERIPELEVPDVMQYVKEPGSQSVMEILELPEGAQEDLGTYQNGMGPAAQTYQELVE